MSSSFCSVSDSSSGNGDGGLALNAVLKRPGALAGAGSKVYIVENSENVVRAVDRKTGIIWTIIGGGDNTCYKGELPATDCRLLGPVGLFADLDGNIYLTDHLDYTIKMMNGSTQMLRTIGGEAGIYKPFRDNTYALSATFFEPWGITADEDGMLFIADSQNSRIRSMALAEKPTLAPMKPTGLPTTMPPSIAYPSVSIRSRVLTCYRHDGRA